MAKRYNEIRKEHYETLGWECGVAGDTLFDWITSKKAELSEQAFKTLFLDVDYQRTYYDSVEADITARWTEIRLETDEERDIRLAKARNVNKKRKISAEKAKVKRIDEEKKLRDKLLEKYPLEK